MAAIIQRLHVTVNKQLGLPDTFVLDCSTESGNESSDNDGEEVSEGSSSPVDISEPTKGGTQKLGCWLILYFISMNDLFS